MTLIIHGKNSFLFGAKIGQIPNHDGLNYDFATRLSVKHMFTVRTVLKSGLISGCRANPFDRYKIHYKPPPPVPSKHNNTNTCPILALKLITRRRFRPEIPSQKRIKPYVSERRTVSGYRLVFFFANKTLAY